jgi:hypothetical protein
MEKYLPIIYVRGYAGSQGAVESTVDRPYYGFNLGSTQVRTGPDGDPDFFIFESPLVRLIKDHGYTDLFARTGNGGAVELLNGEDKRYEAGRFPVRSLIQRVLKKEAVKKIDRLFTYATPHRGIHFRRGLGFLTSVRDLLGLNDSNTFGPDRMREFLGFSRDWDPNRLNEIGGHFPVERVFSLVGTNHTDYNLARLAVGPGSDGLVQMDHAYVKGSIVYRSHSGPLGIVNSEEGYQNLQRFLFGDTSVRIDLENVRLKNALRKNEDLRFLLIETTVLIRGEQIVMTDQREEHGSALTVPARALETGCETLFRTYLMKAYRPSAQDRYSNFQIRLRVLPLYVRNRRVLRDRHYFGEHLFQHTLTVGIRDSDAGDGRLVRARWAGLDSDLPATGKRYPRNDNIRFPLPSKNLDQGDLVLRVRDERSNATRDLP